jgi:hypothetical protein
MHTAPATKTTARSPPLEALGPDVLWPHSEPLGDGLFHPRIRLPKRLLSRSTAQAELASQAAERQAASRQARLDPRSAAAFVVGVTDRMHENMMEENFLLVKSGRKFSSQHGR